jgi:predicted amidohydrolase
MRVKIALAQINTKLGDVPANLAKHLDYIDRARQQGADLIVFPELSLTGYLLQDIATTVALQPTAQDPIFKQLLDQSQDIDIMVGFVDEDHRHRFYIAAAYLSQGQVLHVHHKIYLPTYSLFDEGRFFAWGDDIRAFDTRFGRMGMLICEDFWHVSPPYLLWLDGADILLLASASPGRGIKNSDTLESAEWVEHLNKAYASMFTNFVIHTNRVGYEDGINFWGGATIFDPAGNRIVRAPFQEEALTIQEINLHKLNRVRKRLPLLRDERTGLTQKELNRILNQDKDVYR